MPVLPRLRAAPGCTDTASAEMICMEKGDFIDARDAFNARECAIRAADIICANASGRIEDMDEDTCCLLYTSPSPRDRG